MPSPVSRMPTVATSPSTTSSNSRSDRNLVNASRSPKTPNISLFIVLAPSRGRERLRRPGRRGPSRPAVVRVGRLVVRGGGSPAVVVGSRSSLVPRVPSIPVSSAGRLTIQRIIPGVTRLSDPETVSLRDRARHGPDDVPEPVAPPRLHGEYRRAVGGDAGGDHDHESRERADRHG